MRTIPLIHCFDRNYVMPAAVCFQTLLENAKSKDTIYSLRVVGDLAEPDEKFLRQIVEKFPNGEIAFRKPAALGLDDSALPAKSHFSLDLYNKLALPELFPEFDKAIVADVDVIYLDDIAKAFDFFDFDDDNLLGGVWDLGYAAYHKEALFPTGRPFIKKYSRNWTNEELDLLKIGAGFVVYNMSALRNGAYAKKWIDFAKKNSYRALLPEQEAYNIVCKEKIKLLPLRFMAVAEHYSRYTAMSEAEKTANPAWDEMFGEMVQLHYASKIKPWKYPSSPCADLWFAACARAGAIEAWRKFYATFSASMPEESLEKKVFEMRMGRFHLKLSKERKPRKNV